MMSKAEDILKLEREVKNGEIRFLTVKANIEMLDKEVGSLTTLQGQLEENLACLKKKNIIAIATEFKKVKEELVKIKARSIIVRNDRETFRKAAKQAEEAIAKAKEALEKAQSNSNVLHGRFNKRDNG